MREIKFRAWLPGIGKMTYSHTIAEWRTINIQQDDNIIFLQYTGMKDKNGKEIHDGDILTTEHYPFQDDGKYNYHGVIEWIDECAAFFMTKRLANSEKRGISDGIAESIEEGLEEFEIIGNIYENPELLTA